ncbi:MAG: PH domain-containing protein [Sphingobacteriales bacterium]
MDITLKPSAIFAFLKTLPLLLLSMVLLYMANRLWAELIWLSLIVMLFALYRFIYIRRCSYIVTEQYIRITRGIFFKRIDTVELFRVKDYTVTEPFILQIFKLMDLMLKTTDPENPILWLRGIPQSGIIDTIRERVLESRQYNHIYEIN